LGAKRLNAGERTLYTRLESLAGKRGATWTEEQNHTKLAKI
jgi:hypothetical protein